MLAIELDDLRLEDFDLDLLGFSANELDDLLRGEETTMEGQTDDDDVPNVPEQPISQPGDVWLLGHHRLLCGDATDPAGYELVLEGFSAHLIWTDPPYNVNYANSLKDNLRGKDRPILNDNLGEDFQAFLLGGPGAHAQPLHRRGVHRPEFK